MVLGMSMTAQNLKKHQWENRLLVILTKDNTNMHLKNQLNILHKDPKGCNERKLVLYQVQPDRFTFTAFPISKKADWKTTSKLYEQFNNSNKEFTIYLIGLDGRVKEQSNNPWTLNQIYNFIDVMPMRMGEK